MDTLIELFFVLGPAGFAVLAVLLFRVRSARHGAAAKRLLRHGAIGGGIAAVAAVVVFLLVPALRLPGPGSLVVALMFGSAGFAVAVVASYVWGAITGSGESAPRVVRTMREPAREPPRTAADTTSASGAPPLLRHPMARVLGALGGLALAAYGVRSIGVEPGRGPGAAIALGVAAAYWGVVGRWPGGRRRR